MNPDHTKLLRAWEFIKNNRLATLATISSLENAPEASLVYYLTDENFHIYIAAAKDSRKITNILKNNKVALVVGQEMDPLVIQLEGVAEIVSDENKKKELSIRYLEIANTNTRTPNWPPVMKLSAGEGYVFAKITITYFKFSDFSGTESFVAEGSPKDW